MLRRSYAAHYARYHMKKKRGLAPLKIIAYSDFDPVAERRPLWGDYWLKENLHSAFESLNYSWPQIRTPVLLHLFGKPLPSVPKDTHNILWHHSHPDWITSGILSHYHKIYCISKPFVNKIKALGFEAEWLMVPTNARPVRSPKLYDVVFVGNARRDGTRRAIQELVGTPYQVRVWGAGWEGLLPDTWLAGTYYDHEDLSKLYAATRVVVNDHHQDMRREGFINPRLLDVLASGCLVISDYVTGMEEIFGDSIPTYNSPDELKALVERYLHDSAAREKLVRKGQQIALKFSYSQAAVSIVKYMEDKVLCRLSQTQLGCH